MSDLTFTDEGFSDYIYWQKQDRKTLSKINALIIDIKRNGPLHGIDEANRLVYDIDAEGNIRIMSCRGHYKDK